MDTTLLQEILDAQTRLFQKKGLSISQAKNAALERLLQRASAGLVGVHAFRLRCQLRAAARDLNHNPGASLDHISTLRLGTKSHL